jgi:hypothetical protein
LNLLKALQNRRDSRLSKVVGAMLPAFQKRIVRRQPIGQISKPATLPLRVFKALGATLRHLSSNRSKGFELAGFITLPANSTSSGAERLRTY